MLKKQRTIKGPVSYVGIGLHTGNMTKITFKPAPVNSRIRFVRTDLPQRSEILADIENVVDTARGTTLGQGGVRVHTVEHVLAALAGLEIDNLIIELDSDETPVGDGSAAPFVEVLLKAGFVEQGLQKNYLVLEEPIAHSEKENGVDIVVLPSDGFRATFLIDYKNPALGAQYTSMNSLGEEFIREYAPARTFGFLSEIKTLKEQGLIKGGSLDNAVVIVDREMGRKEVEYLKKLFDLDEEALLDSNGILNGKGLRFENEPCRHKVLDLIGDLFLLGAPLKAHVLATRSGHAANIELVKLIRQAQEKKEIKSKYGQNESKGSLLDIEAIQKVMPHRYPFLLVDRILDLAPRQRVVGIKNVTINEPFFQGHFPGHPIMPGVLIVEAMAQVGGVLLLNTVDDPDNKLVYFMGFDGVRFRKPVMPGDQIRFELQMVKLRKRTCKMGGKAFVAGDLVAEATLMATIVDRDR